MKPKIAIIGLGNMGSAMAKRLLSQGYELTVFNRTRQKAEALIPFGAKVAVSAGSAAASADILITTVIDDHALETVSFGDGGVIASLRPKAIHLSMSTISDGLAQKLSQAHHAQGSQFVGAPVFGRPTAAADGKLFILAGGSEAALAQCTEVFSVLGQKWILVGSEARVAHLMKILGNFMLFSAIESMAEAMARAASEGVPQRAFLEAMTSTVFTAPFFSVYGGLMASEKFDSPQAVNFHLALKDIRLAIECGAAKSTVPMAQLMEDRLRQGIEEGLGDLDVSALVKIASR